MQFSHVAVFGHTTHYITVQAATESQYIFSTAARAGKTFYYNTPVALRMLCLPMRANFPSNLLQRHKIHLSLTDCMHLKDNPVQFNKRDWATCRNWDSKKAGRSHSIAVGITDQYSILWKHGLFSGVWHSVTSSSGGGRQLIHHAGLRGGRNQACVSEIIWHS